MRAFGLRPARMELEGREVRKPRRIPVDLPAGTDVIYPRPSVDGRMLSGMAHNRQTDALERTFVYDFQSGETRLLDVRGDNSWLLPGNRRMLFSEVDSPDINLYDLDSEIVSTVLEVEGSRSTIEQAGFWLSPDARTIVLSRQTLGADIWMLSRDLPSAE
jgi:hypothetical protein